MKIKSKPQRGPQMHHLSITSPLLSKLKPLSLIYVKSQRVATPRQCCLFHSLPGWYKRTTIPCLSFANPNIFSMFYCYLISVNFVLLNRFFKQQLLWHLSIANEIKNRNDTKKTLPWIILLQIQFLKSKLFIKS